MDANTKRGLRKLLIRIALFCLLLAILGTLVLIMGGSILFFPMIAVAFLLSLGGGTWLVRLSPLGMSAAWLKGLLYLLGVVLAPVLAAGMLLVSISVASKYIDGFDTPSSASSSSYSNPFD